MNDEVARDVASASAAYLTNLIASIAREEPSDAFRRLEGHFLAAIAAYRDCQPRPVVEPSLN